MNQKGSVEGVILILIVIFSILIAGGLLFTNIEKSGTTSPISVACCDTMDCHPQTGPGQTLTFQSPTNSQYKNGAVQYDLIKSNSIIHQCFYHGKDSGKKITYPDGSVHPIIYNTSEELAGTGGDECPQRGFDQIADQRVTKVCVPIPDDEFVYVCVKNCNAKPDSTCASTSNTYGNMTTVYDIYMRDADYPTPGVPDVIKNCLPKVSPTPTPATSQTQGNEANNTVHFTSYPSHTTLQIHTFDFIQAGQAVEFPRAFCKPALYLYPPQTESISVKIQPKGKLMLTIPSYPQSGWQVTADPNGNILSNQKTYDYLYYEAAIPDNLIPQENAGYSIKYSNLSEFLTNLLPKLGLNRKEQNQFIAYWMKTLPKSPYYKITIVPQNILNNISPLSISPEPDTVLRVTLNFEPLEKSVSILPPFLSSMQRSGFTVVEWAGMFKRNKNHPFTCLE